MEYHENEITVKCVNCDWTTDLSLLSQTNPTHCPKCGSGYVVAGTGEAVNLEVE